VGRAHIELTPTARHTHGTDSDKHQKSGLSIGPWEGSGRRGRERGLLNIGGMGVVANVSGWSQIVDMVKPAEGIRIVL